MILAIVLSVLLLAALWGAAILFVLPLWIPIAGTAVVALAWAGWFAWRRFRARRAAGEIEKELKSQAAAQAQTARPDQQAEVEAMESEFSVAVQALKSSKLARGGRDALAVLPWYMIIGPPGSGKSTALRASGLKFPYLSKRGGVRGVGGTRNCEWWLTNEAVLLDTAGRYSTQEEDHEEWMSFLDLLARTRKRKPINGLIVAVSVSEAAAETEEEAAELGRRMRERVDEVMARLQMVLPIYVLFTKCDLLPGFVETFADLRKVDRGQVWGFTLPLGEEGDKGEIFRERFDELLEVVEERSLRRLADERHLAGRERIYEFPQQLEAVRGSLAALVDALLTENVYQDTPILRGVYFTSGTQEGRAIDRVMQKMAEAFGIKPSTAEAEPVVEAKSYFLRDVFTSVIIPDQGIAVRSAKALRREAIRNWVLAGAAACAALLCLVFPLRSFLANRDLVESTGVLVDRVAGKLRDIQPGPPPLAELELLRERLDLLVRYGEEGPPLGMRLGLYRGDRLEPPVRRLYAGAVRRLILDPIFRADVDEMNAFVRRMEATDAPPAQAEYARFYDELKLHLLLTSPRMQGEPRIGEAEQAFIGRQVAERWEARWSLSADPAGPRLVERSARLFAKILAQDPALALPRYEDLVLRGRRVLTRVPASTLAVERLAAELDDKGYDLTLTAILGGPVAALRAGASVRGAFTRRGYEEVVKGRLDDPRSLVELWVLAGAGREGEELAAREMDRLRSYYYERYVDEWRRFIESIVVQDQEITPLSLLQDLTQGEPPPFGRLFRAVGYNTHIVSGVAAAVEQAESGVIDRMRQRIGGSAAGRAAEGVVAQAGERAERRLGPRDVERAFAGLAGFGYAPEPPPAAGGGAPPKVTLPIDLYQEQLAGVREALQMTQEGGESTSLAATVSRARLQVEGLINRREVGWRPRLKTLLLPPIGSADSFKWNEDVRRTSGKWCSAVALWYRDNLAHRYPFDRDSRDDAAMGDVAAFFRPGSGILWKFYGESLSPFVQRAGSGFQLVRAGDRSAPFKPELVQFLRRAHEVTGSLFPPGATEPVVSLSLRIRPTPRIASVSLEIDGQRVEYRNGPEEWNRVSWPGQGQAPGALLRVRTASGAEESLVRDGDWAFLRLLEAGRIQGAGGTRDFTVAFPMQALGATITIDFRTARSETPFFGARRGGGTRFLEPFRGLTLPLSIGGGASCGDGMAMERR
jgi:type VI secretion system protein ImpL